MTDGKTKLFQLFGHARASKAAQCKTVLHTDMRQDHEIPALTFADRLRSPGTVSPRRHLQHAAQSFNRPDCSRIARTNGAMRSLQVSTKA
jgi:hypothetical protein